MSTGGRAVAAFTGGVCLRQRVRTVEFNFSCLLYVPLLQVVQHAGTTATWRPTWKLWHWSGCHPTFSLWICSKLVKIFSYLLFILEALLPLSSLTITPLCSDVIPVPEPCLDSFVFLRAKESQENILVEPETDDQRWSSSHWNEWSAATSGRCCLLTTDYLDVWRYKIGWCLSDLFYGREYVVDLEEGSQHLMRYRTIAPLVSTGAVQLIWIQT